MDISVKDVKPEEGAPLLWGWVMANLAYLERCVRTYGAYPSIIQSIYGRQVRYKRRDPEEWWKLYRQILETGVDDCEGLACAVAAEMIFLGYNAAPYVYKTRKKGIHHVVVWTARWGLIDPSRQAGMGWDEV